MSENIVDHVMSMINAEDVDDDFIVNPPTSQPSTNLSSNVPTQDQQTNQPEISVENEVAAARVQRNDLSPTARKSLIGKLNRRLQRNIYPCSVDGMVFTSAEDIDNYKGQICLRAYKPRQTPDETTMKSSVSRTAKPKQKPNKQHNRIVIRKSDYSDYSEDDVDAFAIPRHKPSKNDEMFNFIRDCVDTYLQQKLLNLNEETTFSSNQQYPQPSVCNDYAQYNPFAAYNFNPKLFKH